MAECVRTVDPDNHDDVIAFCQQLSVMLETGVPLSDALDAFCRQMPRRELVPRHVQPQRLTPRRAFLRQLVGHEAFEAVRIEVHGGRLVFSTSLGFASLRAVRTDGLLSCGPAVLPGVRGGLGLARLGR